MKSISDRFFQLPTLELAPRLLGAKLSTRVRGRLTSGIIVEVEAYHGGYDEASHSYGGKTARNEVMFRAPGHCYVYFIYGVHHGVNVVSEREGTGAAILIRALEPLEGVPIMQQRRGTKNLRALTSGPGKLCEALAIRRSLSGAYLGTSQAIWLEPYRTLTPERIGRSRRIGISKAQDLEWRFFEKGSPFLSRKG